MISPDGEQLGVMTPDEGREHARGFGLDLVEVAPNARPPVCRIMDYGKFRYEQSKKKKQSASSRTSLKTMRLRPNIDDHDLNTKLRKASSSLDSGDQVKLVMRLRGRERSVTNRWVTRMKDILSDLREQTDAELTLVQPPRAEGRQIIALVEPASS